MCVCVCVCVVVVHNHEVVHANSIHLLEFREYYIHTSASYNNVFSRLHMYYTLLYMYFTYTMHTLHVCILCSNTVEWRGP